MSSHRVKVLTKRMIASPKDLGYVAYELSRYKKLFGHHPYGRVVARAERKAQKMGKMEYQVIVNLATGAHYTCKSLEEAQNVFASAGVAETGDRLLTVNGVIVRREFFESD